MAMTWPWSSRSTAHRPASRRRARFPSRWARLRRHPHDRRLRRSGATRPRHNHGRVRPHRYPHHLEGTDVRQRRWPGHHHAHRHRRRAAGESSRCRASTTRWLPTDLPVTISGLNDGPTLIAVSANDVDLSFTTTTDCDLAPTSSYAQACADFDDTVTVLIGNPATTSTSSSRSTAPTTCCTPASRCPSWSARWLTVPTPSR